MQQDDIQSGNITTLGVLTQVFDKDPNYNTDAKIGELIDQLREKSGMLCWLDDELMLSYTETSWNISVLVTLKPRGHQDWIASADLSRSKSRNVYLAWQCKTCAARSTSVMIRMDLLTTLM